MFRPKERIAGFHDAADDVAIANHANHDVCMGCTAVCSDADTKGTAAPLRFLQASRWGRAFPVVSVVAVLLFPRFYPYMQS